VIRALKLDTAQAPVAEHVASNADVRLTMIFGTRCRYIEELLESFLAGWEGFQFENNLFIVAWIAENER